MKKALCAAVLLCVCAVACSAAQYTYVDLINRLTDLEQLSVLPEPGEKCLQWSSYDRASVYDETNKKYLKWDANGDGRGIIREENGQQVFAEIEGPGCIWRIWSAAPRDGHVRIYLDGNPEPVVDLPFKDYFNCTSAPFVYKALVHDTASGKNSYVPIPFRKSCKITADKGWGDYYHFTYTIYPKDTQLPTFKRELSDEETAALDKADRFLRKSLGTDPADRKPRMLTAYFALPPGGKGKLATIPGPMAITGIIAKLDQKKHSPEQLRQVILRIYWDGEKEPSVWTPLGDFFGTAPTLNKYRSLPLGVTENECYSYWYMPFGKSAVIELENMGSTTFEAPFTVLVDDLSKPVDQLGRFHAKWHRDAFLPPEPERWIDWTMLTTEGRGRSVGVALEVWNPMGGWWGEGDEKFHVDGEMFPSTIGTGSEDYFGYAWCNPTLFENCYHNQPRSDGNAGHTSVNRWHVTDNVPFHTSFTAYIEKYYKNDRPTRYACTAYWYQAPGGSDPYKGVAASDLFFYQKPFVHLVQGAIEGEKMKIIDKSAGNTGPQGMIQWSDRSEWSEDIQLFWTGANIGDKLVLAVPVKKAGKYAVKVRLTKAPDYGIVQLYLDETKVGDPIDLCGNDIVSTGEIDLGAHELAAGEHKLTLEIAGKNDKSKGTYVGFDYIRLARAK